MGPLIHTQTGWLFHVAMVELQRLYATQMGNGPKNRNKSVTRELKDCVGSQKLKPFPLKF